MLSFAKPTAGAVAVAALLAMGVLTPAAEAASPSSPQLVAQASTTAPAPSTTPAPAKRAKKTPVDRVEARITDLHSRLKITPQQQSQWDAFAQVMRDNAKAMTAALDQRAQMEASKTETAVDDMKSYQAITQAHADGMTKLVPAFEALYDSMSPEQKKNADEVFGSFSRRRAAHGHHAAVAPAKP
ncbi:MAG TPA: Spy/CpxP family protein refolding chaperone [Stellaceae bacterium]|nr:Spy/CpxP family protein refolding chaperone [Stellaceae bacterium]